MSDAARPLPRIRARSWLRGEHSPELGAADLERPIGERFEAIAARDPDAPAVKTPRRAVTDDELDRVANRLARAMGPGPSAPGPVALLFDDGIPLGRP